LRDVVWSTAVQHGPHTDVILVAIRGLVTPDRPLEQLSDADLIRAIYAQRGRRTPDRKLARFPGVSDRWIPALTRRFEHELRDALKMLEQNGK
jgi:hypothetical protein